MSTFKLQCPNKKSGKPGVSHTGEYRVWLTISVRHGGHDT